MKNKLPQNLKPLFWSYNFDKINPTTHRALIVANVVNYGRWEQWQWLVNYYGSNEVKEIIQSLPTTQFRQRALKLISLLLDIKESKHAFGSPRY